MSENEGNTLQNFLSEPVFIFIDLASTVGVLSVDSYDWVLDEASIGVLGIGCDRINFEPSSLLLP